MQVRLVAHRYVQGVRIRLRVDGDGANAQPLAGARDAHGDLAAVGYKQFVEHQHCAEWVTNESVKDEEVNG